MRGALLYPSLDSSMPRIVTGSGITLTDDQGKEYIDGSSGVMISNIGHGREEIAAVAYQQIMDLAFCYRSQFRNTSAESLASQIAQLSKTKFNVVLLNSGSEANEAAVRIAVQYFREIGLPKKNIIIGREISNHGNTVASLSVGHNARRDAIEGLALAITEHKIPACYCYRCPFNKKPQTCQLECADALNAKIEEVGADNVAAFIAEPNTATAGGVLVPHPEYFKTIRAICDRHNILLIADEVVTGLGRTGKWFGMHHWSVSTDITVLGKGINGGYAALSAITMTDKIVDAVRKGSGKIDVGHTHSANPLASAISMAVVQYLIDNKLPERASLSGELISQQFELLASKYPIVGDARSIGMLGAIEFVKDRSSKEPYPKELQVSARITTLALENGLVIYPCRDLMKDGRGDAILIAPPLNSSDEEILELFRRLDLTIASVSNELSSSQV